MEVHETQYEWKREPLGHLFCMTSGGTPNRKIKEYYKSGTIPWVKSGELEFGIITDTEEKISEKGLQNSSAKIFPKGTLLVALYGATIGKLSFLGIDAATNQAVCGIFESETVSLKYLYYYLMLQRPNLIRKGIGGAQPNISQTILRQLIIPYPVERKEQERIVARIEELFSQLDNGVETLQKTKQQLAVYRQAVLQQAFRPSVGWTKKTVSEIGEVNLGRQRSPKNVSNQYPTKYIRAANITEQGLNLDDILDMEFTPSERKKYYLKDGDIVISEASGSASQVGKPAIWRNEIPDCCFQNTVIRHRVYTEHPEYIFWYYKYLYQSGYFSRIVGGVGINHLGAQNFANIMINVAPFDKQLGIVEQIELKMSVCDDLEKTVGNAIHQAEAMRQGILKQVFEGHY